MKNEFQHISVMPGETVAGLVTDLKGTYVDCTLGGAGHARLILERLGPEGRLIGIDQDARAVAHGRQWLGHDDRATVIQGNFADVSEILRQRNLETVHGMLFDLGVSSPQVDEAERGFSYRHDALLDMRMNQGTGASAADIVNTASIKELTHIFMTYGEERWASRIAQFIAERRGRQPVATTGELVGIIMAAIPAAARRRGPHPAKRVFQALRIAVNKELEVMETALDQALVCLKASGRLAVITFHSLEERILTEKIRDWRGKCVCPPGFPECRCGYRQQINLVTRKPLVPSAAEIEANPRARSAKLRIVEKIG